MRTISDAARSMGPVVLKLLTTSSRCFGPRFSAMASEKQDRAELHGASGSPLVKGRWTTSFFCPSCCTNRLRSVSAFSLMCIANPCAMHVQTSSGPSTIGKWAS